MIETKAQSAAKSASVTVDPRSKEERARLRSRLRISLRILVVVLTIASGASIWFRSSVHEEAPPDARIQPRSVASLGEGWDPRYENLEPHEALPIGFSYATAFGVGLLLPALWIVALSVSYVRWRVATMKASSTRRRASKWSGELGHKTLRGKVVAVDGSAEEAIAIEIEQKYAGSEWKETSRRRTTHPFTLELPDGQHLRIEPDDRARLVDALDEPVEIGKGMRLRAVRLTLGEEVCVMGRIDRGMDPSSGYRGQGEGRVMRPPHWGRMLLSTGALDGLLARRARSARNWLMAWLFCFFLPCWIAYFPFWVTAIDGEPGTGTVVAKSTKLVKRHKKADYQTDVVTVRIDATGQQFTDWLRPSARGPEIGARVPVFYAPSWVAYARVGKAPTVDLKDGQDDLAFFGAFQVFALMVVFGIGHYVRRLPWWERKRLDESLADVVQPEPQ